MFFVSLFFYLKITMEGRKKMITIIEQFKTNLIEDDKSTNTVQNYVGDISAFIKL